MKEGSSPASALRPAKKSLLLRGPPTSLVSRITPPTDAGGPTVLSLPGRTAGPTDAGIAPSGPRRRLFGRRPSPGRPSASARTASVAPRGFATVQLQSFGIGPGGAAPTCPMGSPLGSVSEDTTAYPTGGQVGSSMATNPSPAVS